MRCEDETASEEGDRRMVEDIGKRKKNANPDPDESGGNGSCHRREFIGELIVEELPISISSTVFRYPTAILMREIILYIASYIEDLHTKGDHFSYL